MAAAASASSSCSSAGAFWRERRRDPEDPPAVDLPPSTAPGLAQRLAEALVTVVYKALDPGPEEDKAAAAVVVAPQLLKEGGGAQFGGRRPRLAERVPLTVESAHQATIPSSKGLGDEAQQQQQEPPQQAQQDPSPPLSDGAAQPAAEEGSNGRRSARQASRALTGKRPAWAALMAGSEESCWWWSGDEDEEGEDGAGRGKKGKRKRPANEPPARPRTVGRAPVQVFRGVVPRAAIDLLMKGEPADAVRNPWPGVQGLLRAFMQRAFATAFRHPYIAEISSRCDSVGPPQRLDLALSPSGVRALLTPPAVAAIEAIVWGLKRALSFTGKVTWDPHLVIVFPGAPEQRFHVDSARSWFYFTLLMPLTKDPPSAGRTEFFHPEDQPPVPVVGDCLCFDGRRRHRGQRNGAKTHVRVFLYIAVYSGTDFN